VFDELVPGTAQKLIELAISESGHRRDLETKAVDANIAAQRLQLDIASRQNWIVFASDTIGQFMGFLMSAMCIGGAVWMGLHEHEAVALALAAVPTAAIVKAFFASRNGDGPKQS
jgi:uncharacterized membrane protein